MTVLEITEKQNEVIRIQSGVIDELFRLLLQHVCAEEIAAMPCFGDIRKAVELIEDLGIE